MSFVNGEPADDWIEPNLPKNGMFRAYWSGSISYGDGEELDGTPTNTESYKLSAVPELDGGATLDPDEGEGLRWEWPVKNGKRLAGKNVVTRGWWPNGNLKCEWTFTNKIVIKKVEYDIDGAKIRKSDLKRNGKCIWTYYHLSTGEKRTEGEMKNGQKVGKWIYWHPRECDCINASCYDYEAQRAIEETWDNGSLLIQKLIL